MYAESLALLSLNDDHRSSQIITDHHIPDREARTTIARAVWSVARYDT